MSIAVPPLEILKSCARNMLAEERHTAPKTKLGACYETLARELGMRDWNTLCAAAGPGPVNKFGTTSLDKGQVWLAFRNPYQEIGYHTPWDLGRRIVVTDVTITPRNHLVALRHVAGGDEWEISAANFVRGFYPLQDVTQAREPIQVGETWVAVRNSVPGARRRWAIRWTLGLDYTITSIDREANRVMFTHAEGEAIFDASIDEFTFGFERFREPDHVESVADRLTTAEAGLLTHLVVDGAMWGEVDGAAGEMAMRQQLIEIVDDVTDTDFCQVALTGRGREVIALLRQRAWIEDRDFGDRTQLLPVYPWPGAAQASL